MANKTYKVFYSMSGEIPAKNYCHILLAHSAIDAFNQFCDIAGKKDQPIFLINLERFNDEDEIQ